MAAKDQENNQEPNENQSKEQNSSKKSDSSAAGIILLAVFLIILLCIPIIFTKFNILGAGESLRPILKTNSVFRYFLPSVKDPNDAAFMNRDQLLAVVNDLKGKIGTLETQLNEANRVAETFTGAPDGFQKFDLEKAQVETQKSQLVNERTQLEKDKTKFYEMVKNQDKPSFKEFYERMDATTAQKIYNEVMQEEKVSNQIKAFVDYYQKMDPSACAKIFENIAKSQIELVAQILRNMDAGKASKVLQAMDSKIAGAITEVLAKQLPIPKY